MTTHPVLRPVTRVFALGLLIAQASQALGPTVVPTAEGQIGEHEPGDRRLLHDVTGAADDHGGEPRLLEMARDQTHGLVANRSQGNEHHQIDIVFCAPRGDGLGVGCRRTLTVGGRNGEEPIVE